jgi:hypothetical protein
LIKQRPEKEFSAAVWTVHFGYDNQGWPSYERAAVMLNETGKYYRGIFWYLSRISAACLQFYINATSMGAGSVVIDICSVVDTSFSYSAQPILQKRPFD